MYPKTPFLKSPHLEAEILKVNCASLSHLLEWLCLAPQITTYRVNTLRIAPEVFRQTLVDKLLTRYGPRAPQVFGLKGLPEVICVAPLDPADIADTNIDPSIKEVVVDSACGAALLRGAHIYGPGVLAMEHQTRLQDVVNVFADLSGQCKRGAGKRLDCSEKIFLGRGTVQMQRYQLFNDCEPKNGVAVEMLSTVSGVASLGDMSCADALLQNLPSIVCVRVLNPQPGDRVLDMCAAPGNKTSHIAALMGDVGCIMALDNSKNRVQTMRSRLDNYRSIQVHLFDSTKAVSIAETGFSKPPFPCNSFDRILLDAPCSGLGNRPQLSCQIKKVKVLYSYPNIQRQLFAQAVQLLRPGGALVYSTCTVTEAECEGIVSWALEKFSCLHLVEAAPRWGGPGFTMPDLDVSQAQMLQRFGPKKKCEINRIDSVGFFIAKFEKHI